jgi:ABC-type nitrate/sulfonate/bicarbonate transport system ATPase subunit
MDGSPAGINALSTEALPDRRVLDGEASAPAVSADIRLFGYRSRLVLQGLNLLVEHGEAVAVLGSSGCGKSTLIRLLAGLLPPGTERFDGDVALSGSSPFVYRSTGKLAVMFQDPTLLPHMSVEQNIALPLHLLRREGSDDVQALLRLVGLQDFRHYLPRDLSGGMRTRTALARSFVSRPNLLFLDEPFTGLDLGWRESLYASLQDLRRRNGTTIVMVTHDLEEAVYNSDRVLVMSAEGTFVEQFRVPGTIPRDYRFGETVARHTALLSRLAQLLGSPPKAELA